MVTKNDHLTKCAYEQWHWHLMVMKSDCPTECVYEHWCLHLTWDLRSLKVVMVKKFGHTTDVMTMELVVRMKESKGVIMMMMLIPPLCDILGELQLEC